MRALIRPTLLRRLVRVVVPLSLLVPLVAIAAEPFSKDDPIDPIRFLSLEERRIYLDEHMQKWNPLTTGSERKKTQTSANKVSANKRKRASRQKSSDFERVVEETPRH